MKTTLFILVSFFAFSQEIEVFDDGYEQPIASEFHNGQLMVLTKTGSLYKNGLLLTNFDALTQFNEQGALSFAINGNLIYVYYISEGITGKVVEYNLDTDTTNEILNIDFTGLNHYGGTLIYKGGKLYLSVGDNSAYSNAQNLENEKGKIIEIDLDGSYEIFAHGLRNPFRMTEIEGGFIVLDVGKNAAESIKLVRKDDDLGWGKYECLSIFDENVVVENYREPLLCIEHDFANVYNSTQSFESDLIGKAGIVGDMVGTELPLMDFYEEGFYMVNIINEQVTAIRKVIDVGTGITHINLYENYLYFTNLLTGEILRINMDTLSLPNHVSKIEPDLKYTLYLLTGQKFREGKTPINEIPSAIKHFIINVEGRKPKLYANY